MDLLMLASVAQLMRPGGAGEGKRLPLKEPSTTSVSDTKALLDLGGGESPDGP